MDTGRCAVVRVVIIDRRPITRKGLAEILGASPQIAVSDLFDSLPSALASVQIAQSDVILVDVGSAWDYISAIVRLCRVPDHPAVACVCAGPHPPLIASRLQAAGISQVFPETIPADDLISQVIKLGSSLDATGPDCRLYANADTLTERELEVLQCVGLGFRNREIAEQQSKRISEMSTLNLR
jgi:DNA-binding NarL/FixJ family response regulator